MPSLLLPQNPLWVGYSGLSQNSDPCLRSIFYSFQGIFNQLLNVYIKQQWRHWAALSNSWVQLRCIRLTTNWFMYNLYISRLSLQSTSNLTRALINLYQLTIKRLFIIYETCTSHVHQANKTLAGLYSAFSPPLCVMLAMYHLQPTLLSLAIWWCNNTNRISVSSCLFTYLSYTMPFCTVQQIVVFHLTPVYSSKSYLTFVFLLILLGLYLTLMYSLDLQWFHWLFFFRYHISSLLWATRFRDIPSILHRCQVKSSQVAFNKQVTIAPVLQK